MVKKSEEVYAINPWGTQKLNIGNFRKDDLCV